MKISAKIYVTQKNNDKYFDQKLPTFRNGFTYITRMVTLEDDPDGVYDHGEYGYITVNQKKVYVLGGPDEFEIE